MPRTLHLPASDRRRAQPDASRTFTEDAWWLDDDRLGCTCEDCQPAPSRTVGPGWALVRVAA